MLKTDIALPAPVGPVVLSTARTVVGPDNIEEGGGRIVSEVSERSFCKHRYPIASDSSIPHREWFDAGIMSRL